MRPFPYKPPSFVCSFPFKSVVATHTRARARTHTHYAYAVKTDLTAWIVAEIATVFSSLARKLRRDEYLPKTVFSATQWTAARDFSLLYKAKYETLKIRVLTITDLTGTVLLEMRKLKIQKRLNLNKILLYFF